MSDFEEPIDPQLLRLLDQLSVVPSREAGEAARGRSKFLEEASSLRSTGLAGPIEHRARRKVFFSLNHRQDAGARPVFRLTAAKALLAAALVIILLLSGTGVSVYAAQGALPGDALYSVKNAAEDARLTLSPDAGDDASLHLLFARRRLEEISALIAGGRFENIGMGADQFERHILQAIAALEIVAQNDPASSGQLAEQIDATMGDYARELTHLAAAVPSEDSLDELESAFRTSSVNVSAAQVEFTARVEAIGAESWIVGGLEVFVNEGTEVTPGIQTGDLVKVHAIVDEGERLVAREIEPAEPDDALEFETIGFVEAISPGSWTIAGQEFIVTPWTEIEDVIGIGDMVEVEARHESGGSLTALKIKLAESDDGGSHSEEFKFSGVVQAVGPGSWTINGQQVLVTSQTEIKDSVQVGDFVKVETFQDAQGNLTAIKIELDNSGSGGGDVEDSGEDNSGEDGDVEDPENSGGEGGSGGSEGSGGEDGGSSGGEDSGGSDHPGDDSPDDDTDDNSGPGGGSGSGSSGSGKGGGEEEDDGD